MKSLILFFALAASSLAPGFVEAADTGAATKLASLSKKYLLGVDPARGAVAGDRLEDPLPDVSPRGRARQLRFDRQLLSGLATVDRGGLSCESQVDAVMLRNALDYDVWRISRLQDWAWDIQRYNDLAQNAVSELGADESTDWHRHLLAATMRMERLPRFFEQVRAAIDLRRVPREHAKLVAEQHQHLLDGVEETLASHATVFPVKERRRFDLALQSMKHAVSRHQRWLNQVLVPGARGDFRLGAELYLAKAQFEFGSPIVLPVAKVQAEAAVVDLQSSMLALAVDILARPGNTSEPPPTTSALERFNAIRGALAVAEDSHPSREALVDRVRETLAATTAFVRAKGLVDEPDGTVKVVEMSEGMQGVVPAFFQPNGDEATYAVSPVPKRWNDAQAEAYLRAHNDNYLQDLTVHEAMPGHYLQAEHARRNTSVLRRSLASRSFVEGWAVYGEAMMMEEGYRASDPLFRLTVLRSRLVSACNALLDIGIQTEGMAHEEAIALMVRRCFIDEAGAEAKWRRATLGSTQLLTYFVGYGEHVAMRDEAKLRLGAAFDLRAYNNAVLAHGAPPVRLVRALISGAPIR